MVYSFKEFIASSLISRLAQILEYQLHLPPCEVAVVRAIARSKQRGQEAVGVVDVAVEAVSGQSSPEFRARHKLRQAPVLSYGKPKLKRRTKWHTNDTYKLAHGNTDL